MKLWRNTVPILTTREDIDTNLPENAIEGVGVVRDEGDHVLVNVDEVDREAVATMTDEIGLFGVSSMNFVRHQSCCVNTVYIYKRFLFFSNAIHPNKGVGEVGVFIYGTLLWLGI